MSTDYENEFKDEILEPAGMIVIRSAGSMGEGDLVAINPETSRATLIEVKSVKNSKIKDLRREGEKEQYKAMVQKAQQGLEPIYAVRYKKLKMLHGSDLADKWRIFDVKTLIDKPKKHSNIKLRYGHGVNPFDHWITGGL